MVKYSSINSNIVLTQKTLLTVRLTEIAIYDQKCDWRAATIKFTIRLDFVINFVLLTCVQLGVFQLFRHDIHGNSQVNVLNSNNSGYEATEL